MSIKKKANNLKFAANEVQSPLTETEKESMLAHLIRMPGLFSIAFEKLDPSYFSETDRAYAVLWRAALNVAKQYNDEMPTGAQMRIEIELEKLIDDDPIGLSSTQTEVLFGDGDNPGLLQWIFNLPESDLIEDDGRALLRKFLEDRTIFVPIKELVSDLGPKNPAYLSKLLSDIEFRQNIVDSVTDTEAIPAFPAQYAPKPLDIIPTNISFLDDYMSGGQAVKEVYVILGPTGVGKTLLTVQIACQGALYEQELARRKGDLSNIGHWYIFTYEQAADPDIWHRIWSNMAQIHIDTFRKGEPLSTAENLKPYEREKYRLELEMGKEVPGEQERYQRVFSNFKPPNLWMFDMSGSKSPNVGKGSVSEIVRVLDTEVKTNKRRVAGLIIDYAGLVVKRNMSALGISHDHLRHELGQFIDKCRMSIAGRFNCPMWVMHQLAGAANKKNPTQKQHHADAAECKSFSDNAWFSFNLGTKDFETSTCRITCTKNRRAAGDDKEKVIYIDGAFCTMRSAEGLFALNSRTNRIVPVSMDKQIVRGTAPVPSVSPRLNPAAGVGLFSVPRTARNIDLTPPGD